MSDMQDLLLQASNLIKSESNEGDTNNSPESEVPSLAEKGDTQEIGAIVRTLEKNNASPNIRKILHYFAQSESERGKILIQKGDKEVLIKVLDNIATAFRLANTIDSIASKQN